MHSFVVILLLSAVMAVGSVAAGYVPLALTLTENRVKQISSLGIGILVGTSMIVIIPEGVETLYGVQVAESNRQCIGISIMAGFAMMFIIDKVPTLVTLWHSSSSSLSGGGRRTAIPMTNVGPASHDGPHNESSSSDILDEDINAIDDLDYEFDTDLAGSRSSHIRGGSHSHGSGSGSKSLSTMVGLVIHAFADGIALGASVASDNGALELVVFLAIMIHKAPASFGLSTVLLRDDSISPLRVRLNLFVFAGSAPVGAIVTYLLIQALGGGNTESINWWTAILLLFSGGTFLYVAMHVMQELNSSDSDSDIGGDNGFVAKGDAGSSIQTEVQYFVLALIGMALPSLTLYIPEV